MSTKFDLDEALQIIIQNKTFEQDIDKWTRIHASIPRKIQEIISVEYSEDLQTEIQDPLNPSKTETLESFINRITKYLEMTFPQNPPFTIVRFAELLQSPKQYNSTGAKFLRALENVVQVSSSTSDFPKPTFESTIESKEGTTDEDVIPVSMGANESKTTLLIKIPWLTEDDIKELESDSYLVEEYPISAPTSQDEFDSDEHPLDSETEGQDEQGLETDRKRQLEGSKDSPEKKYKADTEHAEHAEGDTSTIGNDTLEEDRADTSIADTTVGDATLGDTSIADTTVGDSTEQKEDEEDDKEEEEKGDNTITEESNEKDEEKSEEQEKPKSEDPTPKETLLEEGAKETKDNHHENKDKDDGSSKSNVGNETLDEDTMDMNTTLEEDKMELD